MLTEEKWRDGRPRPSGAALSRRETGALACECPGQARLQRRPVSFLPITRAAWASDVILLSARDTYASSSRKHHAKPIPKDRADSTDANTRHRLRRRSARLPSNRLNCKFATFKPGVL